MANAPQVDKTRQATLTRLEAQKILALQAGNTKAASLIQSVIDRIRKGQK